jgi:hypothetical protein
MEGKRWILGDFRDKTGGFGSEAGEIRLRGRLAAVLRGLARQVLTITVLRPYNSRLFPVLSGWQQGSDR